MTLMFILVYYGHHTLKWRHNEHDGVSNHQVNDCLLNRLFRCRLNKTSMLRVTGPCAGNPPVTGEFPTQKASNAENVSIWWRHHEIPNVGHGLQRLPYVTDMQVGIDGLLQFFRQKNVIFQSIDNPMHPLWLLQFPKSSHPLDHTRSEALEAALIVMLEL